MPFSRPAPSIRTTSRAGNNLPEEVNNLAQAIMRLHGSVLITREKNGLHLNFACPDCLEREGSIELSKRHFAFNAEKYLTLGAWVDKDLSPKERRRVCVCMKCGARHGADRILSWASLDERGIRQSRTGRVNFVDNTAWLVTDVAGHVIPGGPGDGEEGDVIPVNALPDSHPAVQYLRGRDYNLNTLWEQFRCSYCVREWPEDRAAGRFYRKMPEGFRDSPQGRIIFYADMEGVQKGWQARIIEHEFQEDGRRYKSFWNGVSNRWHTMEYFDDSKGKFRPLPQYDTEVGGWSPRKYRNANGALRNELLYGLDAAILWNKTHRRNNLPVGMSLEGPLDAGRFGPPAMAKTGKFTSDEQIEVMCRHFSVMVEVPDNDKAGRDGLADTWSRMEQKITTHVWELPDRLTAINRMVKDAGDLPDQLATVMKTAYLANI